VEQDFSAVTLMVHWIEFLDRYDKKESSHSHGVDGRSGLHRRTARHAFSLEANPTR